MSDKLTQQQINYYKDRISQRIKQAANYISDANEYIQYIGEKDRFTIINKPIKDEHHSKKIPEKKSSN